MKRVLISSLLASAVACDAPGSATAPAAAHAVADIAVAPAVGASFVTDAPIDIKVERVATELATLEAGGYLSHGDAASLGAKLEQVRRALGSSSRSAPAATGTAPVQQASVVGQIGKAVQALLDFLKQLTTLVTDLPRSVVQPILNAVLDLLSSLVGALTGA